MAGENSDGIFGATAPRWGGSPQDHQKRHSRTDGISNWQSNNAWDIMAAEGTAVYAIAPGTVARVKSNPSPSAQSTIYGDGISISGAEGYPDVYYTHIKSAVSPGNVAVGDLIGYIVSHENNPRMPTHVHIGISGGESISKYVAGNGYLVLKKPDAGKGTSGQPGQSGKPGQTQSEDEGSGWGNLLSSIGAAISDPIGTIKSKFESWLRGLYLEVRNLQTLRNNFENSMFIPDELEKPILDIIDKIIIEAGGQPKTETGTPVSASEPASEEEEVEASLKNKEVLNKYSYKSRPPFGRSNKTWDW